MNQVFGIGQQKMYRAVKPVRDPLYRRFVKRLPCVGCGKSWGVDPAHTGPHGISQKSCDLSCIPLCRKCHDAFDADPQGFAAAQKIDVAALIAKLNKFWFEKLNGGKAA